MLFDMEARPRATVSIVHHLIPREGSFNVWVNFKRYICSTWNDSPGRLHLPRPGSNSLFGLQSPCLPWRTAETLLMFLRDYGPSRHEVLTPLLLICPLNFLFNHLVKVHIEKNIIEILWQWRPQSCCAWSGHQKTGQTDGSGKWQ